MLRKRIIKILPVWLLTLLLIGSAAAAFIWISNYVQTYVNVRERPIEISGDFQTTDVYKDEQTSSFFTYVINNMSQSTGYIYLTYTSTTALNIGDIEVDWVYVYPGMTGNLIGSLVTEYPQNISDFQLAFLYEDSLGGAFDFSDSGMYSFGNIDVHATYKVAGTITASIQITSTSA